MISIKFHFHGTAPIEHERIKGIVCSLAKLEAMLPWVVKLHVAGLEAQDDVGGNGLRNRELLGRSDRCSLATGPLGRA
jgi:hypothetical protein